MKKTKTFIFFFFVFSKKKKCVKKCEGDVGKIRKEEIKNYFYIKMFEKTFYFTQIWILNNIILAESAPLRSISEQLSFSHSPSIA